MHIGKTRLIKLLYLLDIENYKSYQRIFTELDWIFYKYGPYAFEIEKFLDLWRDADPGIPEVEDAKKRLEGLKE